MITKSGVYSFGISHKHYRKVYQPHAKGSTIDESEVPGPGHYQVMLGTTGYMPTGSQTTKF